MTTESEKFKLEGNEKYKAKDYTGAIESYSQAISHDSSNAALYTNRAAAHLMVLQYKQAADDCEVATRLDSSNSKAFFRKATALKGLGKLDEAIVSMSAGLDIEPTNSTGIREKDALVRAKNQLEQVEELISAKQCSRALTMLDPLLRELGSGSRKLNLMKVECLVETRRLEEALNLSNAIMRTVPAGDVELLQVRAKCLYQMGDVENAYKHLQQAMRCDPDNTTLRIEFRRVKEMEGAKDRGNTAFQEGRLEEALQEWQTCVDVDPSNKLFVSKIHGNRASALVKLKR
jgi:DnaJ homolog subfamily C member 7